MWGRRADRNAPGQCLYGNPCHHAMKQFLVLGIKGFAQVNFVVGPEFAQRDRHGDIVHLTEILHVGGTFYRDVVPADARLGKELAARIFKLG